MGSIGSRAAPSSWLYRASKAAVNSVLKDISLAFADKAICIAFHPGWVRTDMGGAAADLTPQHSVADMRRTLARVTSAHTGSFLNHDGTPIAW
jgi:NAD(P)-dependent dehydrogenase (short-subunit alcohol dehydrogenase family)